MVEKRSNRGISILTGILALIFLCMLSTPIIAANYQLEIIQPQPNLNTLNRFYKAYPGLEYNVRLAVIGGEFPYRFELTDAPAGMTIDKRGEISWENPIEAGTPYPVTAAVTDASSITKNVTWNITVTKNGFRFIDAVNGKSAALGGTGTFENPWRSMKDWYEGNDEAAQTKNSYSGEFLYWRDGTYTLDGYIDSANRLLLQSANKPQVWLAYPGESPELDMNNGHITIWGGNNTYIDGFEFFINGSPNGKGITTPANQGNFTIRRSKFHGIKNAYDGGNNGLIFLEKAGQGQYWSFQDNEFYDVNKPGYGILGYNAKDVLIEDNVFHGIDGHPVGPKSGTQRWDIRHNTFYNNSMDAIGVQYYGTQDWLSGDIEIRYNLVKSGGGWIRINSNQDSAGYPVYVYRNTFMGDQAQVAHPTSTNGPFYFYKNIIVNETSHPEKIQRLNVEDASRIIVSDNLVGSSADNIVDSQGYLTSGYSSYVGTHGFQIGRQPLAPSAMLVE